MKRYHTPEVCEVMITCALRFRGYEYLDTLSPERQEKIASNELVNKLRLHESLNDNFAAFFQLQRWLFKWGGERLDYHAPDWLAFDFLFLTLYRHDPPSEFADVDCCLKWQCLTAVELEGVAAEVRNSFRRKGRAIRTGR
jgi:hypothetical protein